MNISHLMGRAFPPSLRALQERIEHSRPAHSDFSAQVRPGPGSLFSGAWIVTFQKMVAQGEGGRKALEEHRGLENMAKQSSSRGELEPMTRTERAPRRADPEPASQTPARSKHHRKTAFVS